ncbi:urease accessory protein UreF [Cohnella fermenti]|uniref:Urease accessory protein UreF n=2 Tax=Cohnella fermenti TaxID=2565925 RepID=A0A4S4C5A7_9BACL|nr:urease accessory protein UreF [Cohnella fermenti]
MARAEGKSSWLTLQLLLDSALPIGNFSHSYGLETLVQEGAIRSGRDLWEFMAGMLRFNWSTTDAMVIKAVYLCQGDCDLEYAYDVERLVHYQRLGEESREGIERTGRRLLRLATALWPDLPLEGLTSALREGRSLGTYPLVFGVVCRAHGVPLDRAAEGYLYASASNCVNSALRLMSLGQSEAQRLLAASFSVVEQAWSSVREMEPEEAYSSMPLAEMSMIGHKSLYSRLFMS